MFIRAADGAVFHGYVWPDGAVFANHTRPEVREWWGDMQKALVDVGVSGIWNDMNEPVVFELPFSQGVGKVGTIALDAIPGSRGKRTNPNTEVHNLYGYCMARASYEGLRRHGSKGAAFRTHAHRASLACSNGVLAGWATTVPGGNTWNWRCRSS